VVGTVTTKMKGAYLFNNSADFMIGCEDYFNLDSWSVYDPADYVIPPQVSPHTHVLFIFLRQPACTVVYMYLFMATVAELEHVV